MSAGLSPFYIISSQISGEPICLPLLNNMRELASVLNDATIIIGAQYKENCNAVLRDDNEKTRWYGSIETVDYILRDARLELEGAVLRADVNIRPNAANPLTSVQAFIADHCNNKHAIFFHPNVMVETLPRAIDAPRQTAYTTGCINPNTIDYYRRSVAEAKAKFHHSMGFLVVCGRHVWPVYAERDGSFDFLWWRLSRGKVTAAKYTYSVWGDLHAPNHDESLLVEVMDVVRSLGIKNVMLQDAIDIQYGSHHATTTTDRYRNYMDKGSLTEELAAASEVLGDIHGQFKVEYVVSNHHQHLDTFLNKEVSKVDPADLEMYFELNLLRLRSGKSATTCWLKLNGLSATEYSDFAPKVLKDITIYHGDRGICGAKGSSKSFAKGVGKAIVGHTHAEQIFQGVINPGCLASLPQGYQSGLTKSTQGIVLVAASGKRSLLTADAGLLVPFTKD